MSPLARKRASRASISRRVKNNASWRRAFPYFTSCVVGIEQRASGSAFSRSSRAVRSRLTGPLVLVSSHTCIPLRLDYRFMPATDDNDIIAYRYRVGSELKYSVRRGLALLLALDRRA